MRKLTGFLLMGIIVVTAMSCGGGTDSPASIEKAIYSQMQKGNYEKGMKIYFDNLAEPNPEMQGAMTMLAGKMKESITKEEGIKSFDIEEQIDESGEKAVVIVKVIHGNGKEKEEKRNYVKIDGKWKIADKK